MTLLEEIRGISREAAIELERADCCTDSDICTLTQYDLQELLPGFSNFKIRRKIYETIHKKRPIHVLLNELKSFVPDEFLTDALSNNGPLHKYLKMLKELKVEMTHVQEFLDAHIDLLEKYEQNQDTTSNKDRALVPSVTPPVASSATGTNTKHMEHMDQFNSQKSPDTNHNEHCFSSPNSQASTFPPIYGGPYNFGIQRRPQKQATVTYKMVVSGNTLNSHLEVMKKLRNDVRGSLNLQETQHDEGSQVIIVFCPVVSRAGTDLDAALQCISRNKPVIVVAMHHLHTPTAQIPPRTNSRLGLGVNVFFHESKGLLNCSENYAAIDEMKTKLYEISTKKIGTEG